MPNWYGTRPRRCSVLSAMTVKGALPAVAAVRNERPNWVEALRKPLFCGPSGRRIDSGADIRATGRRSVALAGNRVGATEFYCVGRSSRAGRGREPFNAECVPGVLRARSEPVAIKYRCPGASIRGKSRPMDREAGESGGNSNTHDNADRDPRRVRGGTYAKRLWIIYRKNQLASHGVA